MPSPYLSSTVVTICSQGDWYNTKICQPYNIHCNKMWEAWIFKAVGPRKYMPGPWLCSVILYISELKGIILSSIKCYSRKQQQQVPGILAILWGQSPHHSIHSGCPASIYINNYRLGNITQVALTLVSPANAAPFMGLYIGYQTITLPWNMTGTMSI